MDKPVVDLDWILNLLRFRVVRCADARDEDAPAGREAWEHRRFEAAACLCYALADLGRPPQEYDATGRPIGYEPPAPVGGPISTGRMIE